MYMKSTKTDIKCATRRGERDMDSVTAILALIFAPAIPCTPSIKRFFLNFMMSICKIV